MGTGKFNADYSIEILKDTQLPTLPHFYNKLLDEIVSAEHQNAQTVMETFAYSTMQGYMYMKRYILIG